MSPAPDASPASDPPAFATIPARSQLAGCPAAFSIARFDRVNGRGLWLPFGFVCRKEVLVRGRRFRHVGWFGGNGEDEPIAVDFPGPARDPDAGPSLWVYCEGGTEGRDEFLQLIVARGEPPGGTARPAFPGYRGITNVQPRMSLCFWQLRP